MNDNVRSIYRNQKVNNSIYLFLLAFMMLGFSIYLTQHYFDLKFPTGLESKSLCNLNSFFNCDKTTLSGASNLFGVPISIFGIIIGGITLIGMIFSNKEYERTVYFLLGLNFLGCLILFTYSLVILKGLCPFCTLYYIASGLIFWLFKKNSDTFKPSIPYLAIFGIIFLAISFFVKKDVDKKLNDLNSVSNDLINQFYALPDLGYPKIHSPFKLATAENAPIRFVIFSDFECPACKALSNQVPKLISRYKNQIDIEYFFYPLDQNCNPAITRPLHQHACKAAAVAVCVGPDKFYELHENFFFNQEKFESGFVEEYVKNNKLEQCTEDSNTKNTILNLINASNPFNLRSTPTYLINGVKIEGALPDEQMFAILDEILKRSKK